VTLNGRPRHAFLILTALGVVFGDIGTSPLYALRECFSGAHSIPVTPANVLGVLSLILWSLIVTVSIKYLVFVMRADNCGEGGILALVALIRTQAGQPRHAALVGVGLFGAALLYGDGMITPAISVLSAVEGLGIATRLFEPYVVTITVAILVALFLVQHRGTARVGAVFGPIMIVWFVAIAAVALPAIARTPIVLSAANPVHAVRFFALHGAGGILTLGAVVLAVTGAEALYADMGHFGATPIRIAWFTLVLPSLVLNYFGQGALLLHDPTAKANPFYGLAPGVLLYPMVGLATIATIIASQAIISGAFSLTQQAMQLGYSPRFEISHTSIESSGQIYVPEVNFALMVCTVALVLAFRSSTNLASAYGMAVTATMVITTLLTYVVARERWMWSVPLAASVTGVFLVVDLAFFAANLFKIEHGGWLPLLIGALIYIVMSTWRDGRIDVVRKLSHAEVSLEQFRTELRQHPPVRVPGTAVFMTAHPDGIPPILLHQLRHNKVLHRTVVLLTVTFADMPMVESDSATIVQQLGDGFYRVRAKFGYMQVPNVPAALAGARLQGLVLDEHDTTFYVAHLTLLVHSARGWRSLRDKLFVFLSRNARRATNLFNIPPNRVVEIGMQLEL
jgi:KUP system potassium uptake protein